MADDVKLVLASANPGKQREFSALLSPLGFELLTASQLGIESVEETGSSFTANALLKARHAALQSGLPALADDSGLEVDALAGRPGIYSARYAGPSASDQQNNARLLADMAAVPEPARSARYRCVLALVRTAEDAAPMMASGCWEGRIAMRAAGSAGFGYDPLFIPTGHTLTAAQLSAAQKNAMSHRALALAELLRLIRASAERAAS